MRSNGEHAWTYDRDEPRTLVKKPTPPIQRVPPAFGGGRARSFGFYFGLICLLATAF
jgi:hypothetical protein